MEKINIQNLKRVFEITSNKYGNNFTAVQYNKECRGKEDWPSLTKISCKMGWNNAKKKLGYKTIQDKPKADDIIPHLKKAAEIYGVDLKIHEYNKYIESIDEKVIKGFTVAAYFGWNEIKKKAGLKLNMVGNPNMERNKKPTQGVKRNRFCLDCLEKDDCDIQLHECEYYDYYRKEVANG